MLVNKDFERLWCASKIASIFGDFYSHQINFHGLKQRKRYEMKYLDGNEGRAGDILITWYLNILISWYDLKYRNGKKAEHAKSLPVCPTYAANPFKLLNSLQHSFVHKKCGLFQ